MGTVNYSMFSHSLSKNVLVDRAVIGPAIPEGAGDDTVGIFGSIDIQP